MAKNDALNFSPFVSALILKLGGLKMKGGQMKTAMFDVLVEELEQQSPKMSRTQLETLHEILELALERFESKRQPSKRDEGEGERRFRIPSRAYMS